MARWRRMRRRVYALYFAKHAANMGSTTSEATDRLMFRPKEKVVLSISFEICESKSNSNRLTLYYDVYAMPIYAAVYFQTQGFFKEIVAIRVMISDL